MDYKLTKTETGKKAQKYLYTVTDENGTIISSRNSNREYVACTKCGSFYFGRLDLIGKGDYKRVLESAKERESGSFRFNDSTDEQHAKMIEDAKKDIDLLTSIAYLQTETTPTPAPEPTPEPAHDNDSINEMNISINVCSFNKNVGFLNEKKIQISKQTGKPAVVLYAEFASITTLKLTDEQNQLLMAFANSLL